MSISNNNNNRFFRPSRWERIDTPHSTSYGDPFESDDSFPSVFAWKSICRRLTGWMCIPGMGSFFPHLYLPLSAMFFFRSLLITFIGVFSWTVLIELPVFLFLKSVNLLPSDRCLWDTFIVCTKVNPSYKEVRSVLLLKNKYENPDVGKYFAVIGKTKRHFTPTFRMEERSLPNHEYEDGSDFKEICGIVYWKMDVSSYILWSIIIDILVGLGGAILGAYIIHSFHLDTFRDTVDVFLVLEYFVIFFLVVLFTIGRNLSFWLWLFGMFLFGSIFIIGAINQERSLSEWTSYLVYFGITIYYCIVFFRNPLSSFYWWMYGGYSTNYYAPHHQRENDLDSGRVVGAYKGRRYLQEERQRGRRRRRRLRASNTEDVEYLFHDNDDDDDEMEEHIEPPEEVIERTNMELSAHRSWWIFAVRNFNTDGYNAWFGSMILFIIIAIIALSL
jgi:hypothetical protein